MDLTEAEAIKKRWQKYTEKLYKKDLHDPDKHNGVITHLELDILGCEVKWALESIAMNKEQEINRSCLSTEMVGEYVPKQGEGHKGKQKC